MMFRLSLLESVLCCALPGILFYLFNWKGVSNGGLDDLWMLVCLVPSCSVLVGMIMMFVFELF